MATTVNEFGEIVDDGTGDTTPTPEPTPEPGWETFPPPTPTPTPAPDTGGWTSDEVGNKYKIDSGGNLTFKGSDGKDYSYNTAKGGFTDSAGNLAGDSSSFLNIAKKLLVNPDGTLKSNVLGAIGGGLLGAIGAFKPSVNKVGYQGGLKDLVAQRTMATAPVAGRRPGAGGTNYGGDVQYTERSANAAAPAAPVQTVQPDTTPEVNPWAGKMHRGFAAPVAAEPAAPRNGLMELAPAPQQPRVEPLPSPNVGQQPIKAPTTTPAGPPNEDYGFPNMMTTPVRIPLSALQPTNQPTQKAAQGGLMGLAHGGHYLQGDTDGMADKLRTSIDGKQPAALSHGEFVVPADVVSHLGNGNSDAGAKKLYSMMDKIRQARTGTKKQGKQINPDKFMPGGLAAAYAAGGSVSHFVTGGSTDLTGVPSGTTGVEQTLAGWTGTYAPDMLAKTAALTNAPMPQYSGQLTAGASNLQNQAFAGASENAAGGYDPTKFTSGTFNTQAAQQYMNPYLQAALDPQIAEARRQSDITAQQNNAAMTKAGAFGGGRQAILTAENQRNLGTNLAGIVGQGYNTAFNNAQSQFNTEQNRGLDTQKASEASRQYGADYGLKALNQLSDLGATQRGITSEGLAADKAAFEAAKNAPYDQLKFQSQMLNGLPIQATNYSSATPSGAQQILAGAGGAAGLLGNKTSYTMDDVTSALKKLGFQV